MKTLDKKAYMLYMMLVKLEHTLEKVVKMEGKSKEDLSLEDYMMASSIHGLPQIARFGSLNHFVKKIWILTVTAIMAITLLMLYMSSQDWHENPTSTSVAQIPIEAIVFPPVTICPLIEGALEDDLGGLITNCSFTKNNLDTGNVCNRIQQVYNDDGPCLTLNNVDMSVNSTLNPEKVTGVGEDNSLRLNFNQSYHGEPLKYRVYISEVGTTVSKVALMVAH